MARYKQFFTHFHQLHLTYLFNQTSFLFNVQDAYILHIIHSVCILHIICILYHIWNKGNSRQTDFFVVIRFPLTMRVEVETDLKFAPPMLPIPPIEEEKEVKSAVDQKNIFFF